MRARIITFYNFKGGVGKTSLAFNYAVGRGLVNKRVLYVDLDPQCNSTYRFGYDPSRESNGDAYLSVKDLFGFQNMDLGDTQSLDIEDLIRRTPYFNVYLLPGSRRLDKYFDAIPYDEQNPSLILDELEEVVEEYDYIVIETGPSTDLLAQNALYASDYIMIPTEVSQFSYDGINTFFHDLWPLVKSYGSGAQVLGIVANKFKRGFETDFQKDLVPLAKKQGCYLFHTRVRECSSFSKADSGDAREKARCGRALSVYDLYMVKNYPNGSKDMRELSMEMEERMCYLENTLSI